MKTEVMKMGAHCAADDFRVPDVNGSGQSDRPAGSKSRGGADDCPYVPWVLDGVQHDKPQLRSALEVAQPARRRTNHREYSLRGLGLGSAGELAFSHLTVVYAALRQRRAKLASALGAIELRRRQDTDDFELRTKQLFVGAHTFHNKVALALTRASSAEIARESQQAHGVIQ
jgi:hypothetical protein